MQKNDFILLVDDEPNVLQSYKRALRNEPYHLLFAKSGFEALEILKAHPVKVIVTDFRMAGMNGIELLKLAKKENPSLVCAILSGYADEKTVQEALAVGDIRRFLLKPIDNNELRKEVKELLDFYK